MNNLYDDEVLKREVIYLHSLWLQGPPTRNPDQTRIPTLNPSLNPNLNTRPRPNYIPPSDLHLTGFQGPVRTQFRTKNPNFHHPYMRPAPHQKDPDRSPEWPVKNPSRSPSVSGWREFKPGSGKKEQPNLSAAKLQRDAQQTCREFFAGRSNLDGETDEGDEDYLLENDRLEGNDEFKFFSRLFRDNEDLKGYYVKNDASGEFHCLVCAATGEKKGRKFKSCLALVQHSAAIFKTKMTKAHRAFAQVVCDVLGWDINNPAAGNLKETQSLSKEDRGSNKVGYPQSGVSGVKAISEGVAACLGSGASTSANVEWPSGWPSNPQETSETVVMSAEERARIGMVQIQKKVSEACKEFLTGSLNSYDEAEEEDSDTDPIDQDVSEGSKEFKFFLRVFSENNELRSYYEKNYENGDFVCLVCAGVGKKVWRRFKDCSGLLQHSTKLLNTKKKRAHRAFARVVCKVFGWDFDHLPLIVVKGYPLNDSILAQNDGTLTITKEAVNKDEASKQLHDTNEANS